MREIHDFQTFNTSSRLMDTRLANAFSSRLSLHEIGILNSDPITEMSSSFFHNVRWTAEIAAFWYNMGCETFREVKELARDRAEWRRVVASNQS